MNKKGIHCLYEKKEFIDCMKKRKLILPAIVSTAYCRCRGSPLPGSITLTFLWVVLKRPGLLAKTQPPNSAAAPCEHGETVLAPTGQ